METAAHTTHTLPDTLYVVMYAEPWDYQYGESEVYTFVYGARYDTLEAAEAFIMDYATKSDERGTFNIIEYPLPPF